MVYVKNIIIPIFFHYVELTQSLVKLPPIEENVILESEAIIRYTFNSLFNTLKLRKIKENTKFNEFSTIHKYFTSLALQDFDTLNQIVRMVRVNDKNNTVDFIRIIDDDFALLQFEENNKQEAADESVTVYILYFLKILKNLKETHIIDKQYRNINKNILKVLKEDDVKSNKSTNLHNFDENSIIDKNEFWEPSGRRIYKGDRTKIGHFPFMASIEIFNNFHCAGSIVKSDLIITASSCLQLAWNNRFFRENPAFLSARVGSSFYNGGGEVIPVLEIYFHPDYNPKNLRNNICVLRLVRHLNFKRRNRRVKKIDIDRQPSNIPVTTPGITILGWGAKQHSPVGTPWKNKLSVAILDIYPLKECQAVYSRDYVTRKNFCAGFFSRGGGACNRDVGGPGIADGRLMGVISFGSPVCGTPDAPTVFTKLGYYSDWIEDIMEMDVPVSKKRITLPPLHDPFTAPPSHSSPKITTFKIPPITGGKMYKIPITLIDSKLRIFDENVFKDFLATMFNSNEEAAKHYVDKNTEKRIKPETTKNYDVITEKYGTKHINEKYKPIKEFEELSSDDREEMDKHVAVTVFNEENYLDEEIEKLIENVNLKEIVKEEVRVTPVYIMSNVDGMKTSHKPKNESVLTFSYLSDGEKTRNVNINPDDSPELNDNGNQGNKGMSIPVKNFKDLTRTKDTTRVLPESYLFGLLSEVFGQEISSVVT